MSEESPILASSYWALLTIVVVLLVVSVRSSIVIQDQMEVIGDLMHALDECMGGGR